MKKVGLVLLFIGICLCGIGILRYNNNENDELSTSFEIFVNTSVSDEEQDKILKYLKFKYDEDFEVLEHTTNYCTYLENDKYDIDYLCEKKEIINNIYKIKNKDDICFYVKKVDLDSSSLEKKYDFQDKSFYDNYITFSIINKIEASFIPLYETIGEVEQIKIYDGIGVEYPEYKKDNNKYLYYILYSSLNKDSQTLVNKNMSVEDYIYIINSLGINNYIKIYAKINLDIDGTNFQEIIKTIRENDFLNLNYGLESSVILFEFNNNVYIKYDEGFSFELLSYNENIMEEEGSLVYDKKIIIDYTMESKDTIFYGDFIELNEIDLKI